MYKNYRVLFVDDEPNILNSLRRGLDDEEYYCHFAGSGKEALEIIKSNNIAVIVTDMRMPEMNGLELLKLVSELSPATIKVVLSGYTQLQQILVTINQVDIFKFVTKPWELADFIQVVRKSLDYYILQEQNANYKKTLEAKNTSYQNILKKINELVDDAKFSKEMLGICGKSLVGFGRDFSAVEKVAFQKVLSAREALFDLMTEKITTQTKEMETGEIASHFSNYIHNIEPDCSIEMETGNTARLVVNLHMLETAIDALWIIFSDDFRNGVYCKIKSGNPFSLTILSLNAEKSSPQTAAKIRTELDAKIELARAVLGKVLELSGIRFRIIKAEGSLIAEMVPKEMEK